MVTLWQESLISFHHEALFKKNFITWIKLTINWVLTTKTSKEI